MSGFPGFPAGALKYTPLPNLFFSGLLQHIEDMAELKVTLHVFYRVHQKHGFLRFVTLAELLGDGTLLAGLADSAQSPEDRLREGLRLAEKRGALLHVSIELRDRPRELYFPNTAQGRDAVAKLRSGTIDIGQIVIDEAAVPVQPEQPNIFTLYEQNIGLLTPLIAEELADAAALYPAGWIEDAFREAVGYNKRHWRYVKHILERWAVEGKRDEEDRRGAFRIGERQAAYARWGAARRK